MQKGMSLSALAGAIEANRAMKHDLLAPCAALEMTAQDDGVFSLATDGHAYPIRPFAHGQIGDFLGVPRKYYDRMATSAPDLLLDNANHWLRQQGDNERMLRTLGGDLRAFLSNRYNRIENEEVATAVLPVLLETPGIEVVSANITERRLYIQAKTDRVAGDVRRGDVVQAGIVVSNSEVGDGAVVVAPMIYRLVCLNGMVLPDSRFRSHHVGRRIDAREDLNAMFSDEAREADDRALLLKVRDVVRAALSEAMFEKSLSRMRELAGVEMPRDVSPEKVVRVLAKKVNANESEQAGILQSLIRGGDLSAWGLVNAITHQAHGGDYDRAVEFEQAGGEVAGMTGRQWTDVFREAAVA